MWKYILLLLGWKSSICCTLCWLHGVRYAQNLGLWRNIYVPWEQEESQRKGKHKHDIMIVAVATAEEQPKRGTNSKSFHLFYHHNYHYIVSRACGFNFIPWIFQGMICTKVAWKVYRNKLIGISIKHGEIPFQSSVLVALENSSIFN